MAWLWIAFITLLLFIGFNLLFQGLASVAQRWLPEAHPWRLKLAGDAPLRWTVLLLDRLQRLAVILLLGGAVVLTLLYS